MATVPAVLLWNNLNCHPDLSKSVGGANADLMKSIPSKDLAVSVDLGVADPAYVANKAEEFIEVVSVCSDQAIGYTTPVPGHRKETDQGTQHVPYGVNTEEIEGLYSFHTLSINE